VNLRRTAPSGIASPDTALYPERDDILGTKVKIPQVRDDRLRRTRLIDHLDKGIARQAVLVCTPAGFGKTTLLADWAENAEEKVAWLSLGPEDNDPVRFWRYVTVALDRLFEGPGPRMLSRMHSPGPVSSRGVVTALLNELESGSGSLALVLDDYHAIESPSVHDDVAFLLGNLPPQLHVVIATRADPPLPLARLRARGHLAELREADLRFTAEEASALLTDVWHLDLSEEEVATLEGRTEGWAVGLQLAALSLIERPDHEAFLAGFTGTHRYVLDYLSEEVLERQPDEVRRFLLDTSILERLSSLLCNAVTGRINSQEMLERIERANLFLIPLDDERRWYRFHHLFRDVLRARLRRETSDRTPELHRRAAAWCEQHGLLDEAIHHALASGDSRWATRLVEEHLDEHLRRGEERILARWLSVLPEETVRSVPALCLAQAWMEFDTGRLDLVEQLVDHAERSFDPRTEGKSARLPTIGGMVAEVPAAIALMRAIVEAVRGDSEGTARQARSALALTGEDEHGPRYLARWCLAYADWMGGRLEEAERAFARVVVEGRATPDFYPVMSIGSTLGRLQRARGKLGAALHTYREGLRFVTESGRLSADHAGESHVGIAEVLYERDQLDDALRHVTEGIELSRRARVYWETGRGLSTLAWIRHARGDAAGALDAMNEGYRTYPSDEASGIFNPAPFERARLMVAQGRTAEALGWTKQRELQDTDEVSYPREPEYLVLARVLLARSEPERALSLLERLGALAASQGRGGSLIQIGVLRSLALRAAGDHEGALSALAEVLSLARPEGYVRVFADEGAPMASLLRSLIGRRRGNGAVAIPVPTREHLNKVIMAFGSAEKDRGSAAAADSGLIQPLTNRELEVLHLLAVGRRNVDIARELVVTTETVKKHVSHILEKLGASSRTQAVAHARDLGLIS
jgi:ATP/maltotriose-dependent transcriptional regulator MalT